MGGGRLVVGGVGFGVLDASRHVVGFVGVRGDGIGTFNFQLLTFDFRVLGEAFDDRI